MANTSSRNISVLDYNYDMITEIEAQDYEASGASEGEMKARHDPAPIKEPNPKKIKKSIIQENKEGDVSNKSIFDAVQTILKKSEELDGRLANFENRIGMLACAEAKRCCQLRNIIKATP